MAALVIYQIMAFIGMDEELAEYPGGLIYMSSGNGYVSEDYYNLKVGPFLRKNLTTKEYIEYGLESELNAQIVQMMKIRQRISLRNKTALPMNRKPHIQNQQCLQKVWRSTNI